MKLGTPSTGPVAIFEEFLLALHNEGVYVNKIEVTSPSFILIRNHLDGFENRLPGALPQSMLIEYLGGRIEITRDVKKDIEKIQTEIDALKDKLEQLKKL
jgi:hypothetical protein